MHIPSCEPNRTISNGVTALRCMSWLILLGGLAFTTLAVIHTKSSVDADASAELDLSTHEVASKIEMRLQAHALVLRSTSAFFEASEVVTRQEFHLFFNQLLLDKNLPGVQGIGFALKIPAGRLDEHVRNIRQEGFPDYHVWPENERGVHTSIVFLEPFSGRNLRAFGYDMSTEPVRREAMERARDKDVAALSGKVLLVQETENDIQAGALMYMPVYSQTMPDQTESERRANLVGWAYSPFRMKDLMQGLLGERERRWGLPMGLRIYDGDMADPQHLLYEGNLGKDDSPKESGRQDGRLIPVDFNGHRWTLEFSWASHPLLSEFYAKVWVVLSGGSIISLLLSLLVIYLGRIRSFAQQLSVELTARRIADQGLRDK